jgi:hypothetical protein
MAGRWLPDVDVDADGERYYVSADLETTSWAPWLEGAGV